MPRYRIPGARRDFAKKLRRESTKLEERVWHELRAGRLDGWKFKRQVPIEGYIVDFLCFEARLIVEMDGPLHREEGQYAKDSARLDFARTGVSSSPIQ
jgi:very-short-patch-repair endonuclease